MISRTVVFAIHGVPIICLRDPVGRTVSHWNMILDTAADKKHGTDWSKFEKAWADSRLSVDSLYGAAITKWLEHFDRDSILLIEWASVSQR